MSSGICAAAVDIVVFEIVAHFDPIGVDGDKVGITMSDSRDMW